MGMLTTPAISIDPAVALQLRLLLSLVRGPVGARVRAASRGAGGVGWAELAVPWIRSLGRLMDGGMPVARAMNAVTSTSSAASTTTSATRTEATTPTCMSLELIAGAEVGLVDAGRTAAASSTGHQRRDHHHRLRQP